MQRRYGAVALMLVALTALGACGQRETLLAVNASATTRTAPDLAIVTLGVIARGGTAQAAQQAQSARMNDVVAAARAAGAEQADVQTVGYSLEPQYVYARNAPPRISGYVSRNIVSVRVRNLEAVSGLIDATVAQGANELQGIHFTYDDIEASREAARAEAMQTARRRAETYAEAAGMRVSRIDSLVEPGSAAPPWDQRRDMYNMRAPAPQQVSVESSVNPGQLDNEASLTVVFALR